MILNHKLPRLAFLGLATGIAAITVYWGASTVIAHDEIGLRPHHIDVPMNPTAVMRAFQESKAGQIEAVEPAAATAATLCDSGAAAGYPCQNIDLQAFMPRADFGASASNDELNDIWGWTDPTNGKEYALVGHKFGTAVVDITVPNAPVHVADLELHGIYGSSWRDIKVYKNHAFVVSEASGYGMQVFDLTELRNLASPPETLFETAYYGEFGSAHNLVINEESGFAYAVGARTANGTQSKCSGGLVMVDIRDPANPTDAGCFSNDGYTHDAQCVIYRGPDTAHEGKEICFASNEDTLTIVDVSNKNAPLQLSRMGYAGSAYTHQGWLTEDHRFFVLDDELDELNNLHNTRTRMFDVSDLDDPNELPVYELDSSAAAIDHNQYVRGRFVYQANYRAGLRILEIDDATPSLSEVAFFDVYPTSNAAAFNGAWSNYPYFASGNVVVSHIEQGLFVVKPNIDRVAFDAPLYHGAELSGTVSVQVVAVDAENGTTPIVGWELDGVDQGALGTWDTNGVSDGLHRLTSWMRDEAGNDTSSTILVTIKNDVGEPNTPPDAVLVAVPETSEVSQEIFLDGRGSSDADDDTLSYSWALIDRPNGKDKSGFVDSSEATTTMTPEKAGTYQVRLTVSDGIVSDSADVTIEVTDSGSGTGDPKPCRGGPKKCP